MPAIKKFIFPNYIDDLLGSDMTKEFYYPIIKNLDYYKVLFNCPTEETEYLNNE